MATESLSKLTLYSFPASQWAGVAHLALAEKGFDKSEYEIKEIDLLTANNFDPSYLAINPNGTIPSLTGPSLAKPLIESADILAYLDSLRPNAPRLIPSDPTTKARAEKLIQLVHSSQLSTNLVLLNARNESELAAKQASFWKSFVVNRQDKLEKYRSELPDHPFYGPKADENKTLYQVYTAKTIGPVHEEFFSQTEKLWYDFAAGVKELNDLIVLPYAAGDEVTAADLHIVPWLSHALWGAGATEINDFETLEKLIGKSVEGFEIGGKIKEWWGNVSERKAFKDVFPVLH